MDPIADGDKSPIVTELHTAHWTVVEQPRELAIAAGCKPFPKFLTPLTQLLTPLAQVLTTLTQQAVPVEIVTIVTEPAAVGPVGKAPFRALAALAFDAPTVSPLNLLTVEPLRALRPDALPLNPVRAFGALEALTLNPLRTLGPLAAPLDPLRPLGALEALTLNPLRAFGPLRAPLDPLGPLGALNALTLYPL